MSVAVVAERPEGCRGGRLASHLPGAHGPRGGQALGGGGESEVPTGGAPRLSGAIYLADLA